jgi:hypothetical protein
MFRRGAFIDLLLGFELMGSGYLAQLLEKSSGEAFLTQRRLTKS